MNWIGFGRWLMVFPSKLSRDSLRPPARCVCWDLWTFGVLRLEKFGGCCRRFEDSWWCLERSAFVKHYSYTCCNLISSKFQCGLIVACYFKTIQAIGDCQAERFLLLRSDFQWLSGQQTCEQNEPGFQQAMDWQCEISLADLTSFSPAALNSLLESGSETIYWPRFARGWCSHFALLTMPPSQPPGHCQESKLLEFDQI